ncbi:TMEM33 [Bugula neritina]|uniref:TMEM33 n=1 Tax=Bugula neritina TaxID=10212 RepID=A0A7J7IYF7_BUGNE|nr:TMEM33 [Bugula neritina]
MAESQSSHQPGAGGDGPQPAGGFQAALNKMNADKVMAAMWLSRLVTIMFSISFVLPLFGWSQPISGQRVLIAGAITSALRLHQRVPSIQMNREFVATLLREDSAHYLLYSILMLMCCQPVSVILMPVFFFALLHVTTYTKTLLDCVGPQSMGLIRKLIEKIDIKQRDLLKLIATVEVTLMPVTLMLVFSGAASIMLPFGYYRFLCLRYTSIRNPYTRTVFNEMRLLGEYLSRHPKCPAFASSLLLKVISFTCRMAPVTSAPS